MLKYLKVKQPCIYIITNKNNTTFYTGVTSNLPKRIWEHKNKVVGGFSSKYNLFKLVYYETFDDMESAIRREKEIKGKSRSYKLELIASNNTDFVELYASIL